MIKLEWEKHVKAIRTIVIVTSDRKVVHHTHIFIVRRSKGTRSCTKQLSKGSHGDTQDVNKERS
jgi:hypothetical protein